MTAPVLPTHGVQQPILEVHPPFFSSMGEDAVSFNREIVGLDLYPWQEHVLSTSLNRTREGKWAASTVGLVVPRQNGKGSVLEARELFGLFVLKEKKIVHTAHQFKTATEHLTRLSSLIKPNPELDNMVRTIKTGNSDPGIYMKDGDRQLRMLARSGGSGRGFSGDLIVLDEAYEVSSAMMEALRPTMATRSNYQLWYASSAGFAYSKELKALRESAKAGDSKRLAYLEWAVDEDDFDPADPRDWARANPTIGYRISWEYMQDEYEAFRKVDNIAGFAREHLGVWEMNAANSKIPEGRWKAARDPRSEIRDDRVTVGLSVNKARRASLSVAGATDDARIQGEVVRNEEAGPWIVQDILALRERWDVLGVVLDASSPAGQWLGALTEAGVEVKALGTRQIAQSDGGFHERVLSGGFVHVGQEVLDQAAMSSAEQPVGGAWCYRLESDLADMTTLKSVAVAVEHFAFVVGGEVKELQEREEMDSWVW